MERVKVTKFSPTDGAKYRWIHDNINYDGKGIFEINLSGIEPEEDMSESLFDWLVTQAIKNEQENGHG